MVRWSRSRPPRQRAQQDVGVRGRPSAPGSGRHPRLVTTSPAVPGPIEAITLIDHRSRGMALEVVGVDEVERLLVGLATDIKESGYNPEVIIGMTRKGLYPALRLAIMLGVPGDRLGTLAAIKGADGRYHVTDLTRVNVAGLRVLAVDDFSV